MDKHVREMTEFECQQAEAAAIARPDLVYASAIEKIKTFSRPLKLNLASGQTLRDGFLNVDIDHRIADIQWDLEKHPWPFEENSVSHVYCSHFIEHVKDLIEFMNDLYTACNHGAKVLFVAPYYSHVRAVQDPTHVRCISEQLFQYFNANWRKAMSLEHYPIKCDFRMVSVQYTWERAWIDKPIADRIYAHTHYNNVIRDIAVLLVAYSKGPDAKSNVELDNTYVYVNNTYHVTEDPKRVQQTIFDIFDEAVKCPRSSAKK